MIRGIVTLALLGLNLLIWALPLFVAALLKLVPVRPWRDALSRLLMWIAGRWIAGNALILRLTQRIEWSVTGVEALRPREWYLVLSNHRSWVDIIVLQTVLNNRIPFLKFFIKQQLIWVPVLGLAWWALDFPFMRRYSREHLERHPEDRGRDLITTREKCQHFRRTPTSVINFLEGTRFTAAKHAAQESPYKHLLRPRPGGVAFVIAAMGDIFHGIVDVTIVYPRGTPSFWDLCTGRLRQVAVEVRVLPIERWTVEGDYSADPAFRSRVKDWLAGIWAAKDRTCGRLHGAHEADPQH